MPKLLCGAWRLFWKLRLVVFVFGFVLLCYGLFREESPPNLFQDSDKYMHCLAFLLVSLSARLAFDRVSGWLLWPLFLLVAPFSEWLQHQLQPSREFSTGDIMANWTGIVLAMLLFFLGKAWCRYRQRA